MRSLFVMDPLDCIHVVGDSTYVTMRECCDRGWPVAFCTPRELWARDGIPGAMTTEVRVLAEPPYFDVGQASDRGLDEFDVVWMRKDPPFDMDYILATYVLDLAPPSVLVVNEPGGLKLYNEKVWAMRWSQFQPATLLSREKDRILEFVRSQPGRSVLKPWDGNGGRGVLVTDAQDRNLPSMVELLTADGQDAIIVQGFIDDVQVGDKRILLFDGHTVGAMLRVPGTSDHRANMHVGATVRPCDLDARDREICDELGPELKARGMVFVGIDVIGGNLTEINVTSPTGIREINALYDLKLERDLVDLVANKVARTSS